ncbi:Exportin-T [Entamoeba marina]
MTQDFVNAVTQFVVGDPNQRSTAEHFLTQLELEPRSFDIGNQVLQMNQSQLSSSPIVAQHITYFALKLIETSTKNKQLYNPQFRKNLTQQLLDWCLSQSTLMIIKKVMQIVVNLLLNNEHVVPNDWRDLCLYLSSKITTQQHKIVTLLFLNEINEGLIEKSRAVSQLHDLSNKVKDSFRENGIQNVVRIIYSGISDDNPSTQKIALEVFAGYISWIDLSFSTDPQLIQRIYEIMLNSNNCVPVLEVLNEIICKGMPPMNKIMLIKNLNILSKLPQQIDIYNDAYEPLCKLCSRVLIELLDSTEKLYPMRTVMSNPSVFPQEHFEIIRGLIISYFGYFLQLFRASPVEQTKDFSPSITIALTSFFQPLINNGITEETMSEIVSTLYQVLYSKFMEFTTNGFDDDTETTNHMMNSLRTIFRSASLADISRNNIAQFFNQLIQFNTSNSTLQTITCHAHLLLQFPDVLMNEQLVQQFISQHIVKYAQFALPYVETSPMNSPLYPAITRFIKFISKESIHAIIEFSINILIKGKCFKQIKDLIHSARSNGFVAPPEWSIKIGQLLKNCDDNSWNTHQFINETDLYLILGDITSESTSIIINTLFKPQIDRCTQVITTTDNTFSSGYIAQKLKNVTSFLHQLKPPYKVEIYEFFKGYCPIIQTIVKAISPEFYVLPPLQGLAMFVGNEYSDYELLLSIIIHITNKQQKLNVQIIDNDYIVVVNHFIQLLTNINTVDPKSELYREQESLLKIYIQLLYSSYLKTVIHFIGKMGDLHYSSNVFPDIQHYIFIDLLVKIVLRIRTSSDYALKLSAVEASKMIQTFLKNYTALYTIIPSYIENTPPEHKEWVMTFFNKIDPQTAPTVTIPMLNLLSK